MREEISIENYAQEDYEGFVKELLRLETNLSEVQIEHLYSLYKAEDDMPLLNPAFMELSEEIDWRPVYVTKHLEHLLTYSAAERNATIPSPESIEIDYRKQYQEEQEAVPRETVDSQKKIEETPQPATPVLDTSTSDSHLPEMKPRTDLYDSATFSQEKLIKNMAKISDERSKIRQKILENQEIIERARRAEIENQSLEIEYQNQEQLLHKLQQFNNLFDEYREYLN